MITNYQKLVVFNKHLLTELCEEKKYNSSVEKLTWESSLKTVLQF
jgi:hypothetical protein